MDQVVVIWRDVTTGAHDDLKRMYAWEYRLSTDTCNVNITTDEPPDPFDDNILARVTEIGQHLLRALHFGFHGKPGINAANFSGGYMVTIGVFNKMHGVFSWDAGLHRAVMSAFREAARRCGLEVEIVFRKEGDTVNETEGDAATIATMEERLLEEPGSS